MRTVTIACLLLLTLPAQGQTPDTTSAARYLPLEVGHVWEYEQWIQECIIFDCTTEVVGYERWTVEQDTVAAGQRYKLLRQDDYSVDGEYESTRRDLVRFDTSQAFGVRRVGESEIAWPGDVPCRLDEPFDTIVECGGWGKVYISRPGEIIVRTEGETETRVVKEYQALIPGSYFGADVGLLYEGGGEFGGAWITLSYARVGDLEYGSERFPVAAETAPPASVLALSVFPNPSRGDATARLSLDVPQRARLAVFDVLGRRVLSADLGAQPAGEMLHRLDTADLPAGVYLVRLDGDAGTAATARVVRH